jgi:hypothetical protein
MCEAIVKEFSANWREKLELVAEQARSMFPNIELGVEALKQVGPASPSHCVYLSLSDTTQFMTMISLWYTRLLEIVKKCWRTAPFARDMVPIASIMYEIRKYGSEHA